MSSVTIDRFELVFLNPEENRWQLFQEAPEPTRDGAIYRTQVQDLLSSVRRAFHARCKEELDLPDHVTELSCEYAPASNDDDVTINLNKLRKVLRRACASGDQRYNKQLFEDQLSKIQNQMNRIVDVEKIEDRSYVDIFSGLNEGRNDRISLKRQTALSLASTLFIARHWDVPGRFSFPEEVRPVPTKVEPWVPCAAALSSFSYSIKYITGCSKEKKSAAERALDYEVELQIAGDKVWDGATTDIWTPYFDLCHAPEKPEETFWYAFYGFLIDEINSGLAVSNRCKDKEKKVHIICIPLRICGYDHFLQLHLRMNDAELENSWDAKASQKLITIIFNRSYYDPREREHNRNAVPFRILLKECLRELLVQIHVAAFQHYVTDALKSPSDNPLSARVSEIFGRHAPNLVRLRKVLLAKSFFEYRADPAGPFLRWHIQPGPVNFPDEDQIKANANWGEIAPEVMADIYWEGFLGGALGPLFRGTGAQRLSEQYQWIKRQVELREGLERLMP